MALLDLPRRVWREAGRIAGLREPGELPGAPPGIDVALLEALCERWLHEPLDTVTHRHLSAWKTRGSYRVRLHGRSRRDFTVIVKEAAYDADEIPALVGFPVMPGGPEYAVFSEPTVADAALLPRALVAEELEAGVRYRYVFEDLATRYEIAIGHADVPELAARLPEIHAQLKPLYERVDASRLIAYDADYRSGLFEYAAGSLHAYQERFPTARVERLLQQLPSVEQATRAALDGASQWIAPIHGDFNTSNVMLRRDDPGDLKLLDWEWAGHGLPHADLASLAKSSTAEVQHQAVRAYARRAPELSEDEHLRLYRWCQLERGVIDASYLATQRRVLGESPALDLGWCVDNSSAIVIDLFDSLRRA